MLKKILLGTIGASALTFAAMPAAHAGTLYTLQGDGGEGRFNASTNVLCAQAYAQSSQGPVEKVVVRIGPIDGEGAVRQVSDITPGNGSSSCHERDVQNGTLYRMGVTVFYTNGTWSFRASEAFIA